jgi:F0F1-type ATP synthase epsilon subunit
MDQFTINIVTPKGSYVSQQVNWVVFPGCKGEIGVLPNHADYIGLVTTGLLSYKSATDNGEVHLIVSGGSAQYQSHSGLTILVDKVEIPTGDIGFIKSQLSEIRFATESDESLSMDEKVSQLLEAYIEVEEKYS